jgi:N-acetyl-gamma-glutamyl-phosphate reductase
VYGLPGGASRIQQAQSIANPGCFATAIQLALLPLAKAGKLTDDIRLGHHRLSTGAGQPGGNGAFLVAHQQRVHLQALRTSTSAKSARAWRSCSRSQKPRFTSSPTAAILAGHFHQRLHALGLTQDEARGCGSFTPTRRSPRFRTKCTSKQVVNTNKCLLREAGQTVIVTSVVDNLVRRVRPGGAEYESAILGAR